MNMTPPAMAGNPNKPRYDTRRQLKSPMMPPLGPGERESMLKAGLSRKKAGPMMQKLQSAGFPR